MSQIEVNLLRSRSGSIVGATMLTVGLMAGAIISDSYRWRSSASARRLAR